MFQGAEIGSRAEEVAPTRGRGADTERRRGFYAQVDTLVRLGYHKVLAVKEETFRLWMSRPEETHPGFYTDFPGESITICISSSQLPLEKKLTLLRLGAIPTRPRMDLAELVNVRESRHHWYLWYGIKKGPPMAGRRPSEMRNMANPELILTADDLVMFFSLQPEFLREVGQVPILGTHHRDNPEKIVALRVAKDYGPELVWYEPSGDKEKKGEENSPK